MKKIPRIGQNLLGFAAVCLFRSIYMKNLYSRRRTGPFAALPRKKP